MMDGRIIRTYVATPRDDELIKPLIPLSR